MNKKQLVVHYSHMPSINAEKKVAAAYVKIFNILEIIPKKETPNTVKGDAYGHLSKA